MPNVDGPAVTHLLIEDLIAKLRANEALLVRSLQRGSLSWTRTARGQFLIELNLRV